MPTKDEQKQSAIYRSGNTFTDSAGSAASGGQIFDSQNGGPGVTRGTLSTVARPPAPAVQQPQQPQQIGQSAIGSFNNQTQRRGQTNTFRAGQISRQLQQFDDQLAKRLAGTHGYGKLTADGLQAMVGMRNSITGQLEDVGGRDTDEFLGTQRNVAGLTEQQMQDLSALQRQRVADAADFARQGLSNQGQLDNTRLSGGIQSAIQAQRDAAALGRTNAEGENRIAAIRAGFEDPLRQATAEQTRNEMLAVGVPEVDYSEQVAAGAMTADQAQAQQGIQSLASRAVIDFGGDPFAARQGLLADIENESDPNKQAILKAAVQNLETRILQNNPSSQQQFFRPQEQQPILPGGGPGSPQNFLQPQRFAEGGIVSASPSAIGGAPQINADLLQNYQQYVTLARQMNVPPVDLDQFSSLLQRQRQPAPPRSAAPTPQMQPNAAAQAQPGVMGFAEGGMVPGGGAIQQLLQNQVDGKMVVDTDPNAPTDSIPAEIDGQAPAALDSGEFVIPKDVVMFFGLEKLNKMIEKARNPQGAKPAAGGEGALAGVMP